MTLTGLFGVDGVALGGDRFGNPCPPGVGCALEFSCDPGRETRVELALSVIAPSHLGFFDIATYLPGRDRFAESCFYYRLARGRGSEGEVIFSVGPLCSSLYGGNDGGIGYITPCDAEAGDNTLTVWVERAIFREGLRDPAFVNPCPVPSDAATRSVDDWPGGCAITAPCKANADTEVDFELGASPR